MDFDAVGLCNRIEARQIHAAAFPLEELRSQDQGRHIGFRKHDNAFLAVEDAAANRLSPQIIRKQGCRRRGQTGAELAHRRLNDFPTKSATRCSYSLKAELGVRGVHSVRYANLRGLVCLTGALVSLAACGGKIRYPNYYILNVPAPVPEVSRVKPMLGSAAVREFSAPSFLRAGPIVYRHSPEQLGFYNYDRWAVDPRSAVTSAFVQTLQARGVFQSVYVFDGRASSDYLVTGRLDRLEEVDKGHDVFISTSVSAQLLDLKTGDVLWRDVSSETTRLEHRAVPELVAGMSQATEQAVTHLVSSMRDRLLQASAPPGIGDAGQQ
jgi:uncharacterized lipoprotein YmbA